MKTWTRPTLILAAFLSFTAYSAAPTASHINMTKQIDDGIEWTKHLQDDIRKGTKSDPKGIEDKLAGIKSFLSAMNQSAEQIITDSPSEKGEGHFSEMRRFQEAATLAAKEFPLVEPGKNPNFSAMKAASNRILKNLKSAKYWHDRELSEIEKSAKD